MFMTTAFAPDRADLNDLILDAPEMVLFCRIAEEPGEINALTAPAPAAETPAG